MSVLKFKNADGTWNGIAAFKGEPGKDGAIQYKPGFGINISEDNVISSTLDPNDDLTVDLVPTEGSKNPVSSGGVFDALGSIDPNIQFTEMPDPNTFDPNKVIQYVGETNEQFTKGYWYKVGFTEIKEKLLIPQGQGHLTGIIPSNHKVEGCFEWTKYINENHAFGTYNPSNAMLAAQSMHFTLYSNKYYWGIDGTVEHSGGSFTAGKHTIVFNEDDGNGGYRATLNGNVIDNVKITGSNEIVLFGRGGTVNFSGYFHYFKIWDLDTGELLAHYVPAYANGVQGLFDKVANKMVKVVSGMVCEGETVDYAKRWEQVDTQPAPVSWPEYDCPIVVVSCRLIDDISEPRYIRSSEPAGMAILEKLNDLYRKGVTLFLLRILTPDQQHIGYLDVLMAFEGNTVGINKFELPKFFETYKYLMPSIESYMSISGGQVVPNGSGYVLRIRDWMIDRFYELTPRSALNSYAQNSAVLLKTNTTSYTPTANFHPATKKYVDDAVATGIAGIPGSDMSNYPTLDQVLIKGNTEEYVPELDYEPATKKYVDDNLANAGGEGYATEEYVDKKQNVFTFYVNQMLRPSSASTFYADTYPGLKAFLEDVISTCFKYNITAPLIVIRFQTSQSNTIYINSFTFSLTEATDLSTKPTSTPLLSQAEYNADGYMNLCYCNATIRGTWSDDDLFTISSAVFNIYRKTDWVRSNQVLTRTNTTAFTPDNDYEPATKKYVDDTVAAASGSGGGITEETDPVFTKHIASTITEDDITNWNNKADSGGIDEESDPTVPVWVKGITEDDILKWNNKADSSAISGVVEGILADKGYITEETEPAFKASVAADITQEDIDYWTAKQNALAISDKYNGAANPVATIADIPINYLTDVNASDVGKDNFINIDTNANRLVSTYSQLNKILVTEGVLDYKKVVSNFDLITESTSVYNGATTTSYTALQGDVYSIAHADDTVYDSRVSTGSLLFGTAGAYDTVLRFKPYFTDPQLYSTYYQIDRYEFELYVNSADILNNVEGKYALTRRVTELKFSRYTG